MPGSQDPRTGPDAAPSVELRLERALARLDETERLAQIGSWELDLTTNRLEWSAEIFRIFELDPGSFAASYEAFLEAVHPQDRARVAETFERSVRERTPYELAHRLLTRTGVEKHVLERGRTFYAEDGTPLRSIGTVQDVTHRQRLRLFEQIAGVATAGVAVADEQLRLTFVSEALLRLWGYERPEEMLGRRLDEFWADPAAARRGIERLGDDAQLVRELPAKTRSGEIRTVQVAASRVLDPDGRTVGFFGLFSDVSERVRAERALLEQRATLQHLVDASPDWIFAKDREHRFLAANQAYAASFGLTPAELLGKVDAEVFPPSHFAPLPEAPRRDFHAEDDRAIAGAMLHDPSVPVLLPTGERRIIDVLKGPMRAAPDGEVFGLFVVGRDVTEQRAETQRTVQLWRQLQAMLEAFPDLLFRLDAEDRFLDARAGAGELLFRPAEEFLGHSLGEILPAEVATRAIEAAARVRAERKLQTMEYSLTMPIGVRHFEARLVPGPNAEVMIVVRNITDRVQTEERLRASEAQLRQAQKLDAIGHLAGGIAHDFNNMLTVVLSVAGALRDELAGNKEGLTLVDELTEAGERATALTRQLLGFARMSPAEPVVLELTEAVRNFSRFLQRVVGEQVRIELQLDPSTWPIKLDPSHLEQILLNFAVNARDAMPNGGRLVFRLRNDDGPTPCPCGGSCVLLEASDEGVGMAPEVRERIFEPFFSTKAPGKGTGLGLATVYGIVRQAGGHVDVESSPGHGATFRVFFPPAEGDVTRAGHEGAAELLQGHGTILLVEDDAAVRAVTRRILRAGGYEVLDAIDPGSALARLREAPQISLLLTDVVMPGGSGPELAREVLRQRPGLPVVFVSGHVPATESLEGLGPLVRKPYTREALLRVVGGVLRRAQR